MWGMFKNGDQEIIVAMMGSTKKWADLRPLIEKGFELDGTPIAKLPPAEEKLYVGRGHSATLAARKSRRGKAIGLRRGPRPSEEKGFSKRRLKQKEEES